MSGARWYALVDGAAQGPFKADELAGRGADLLVCTEGASDWVAAVSIPELASVVVSSGPAASGISGMAAPAASSSPSSRFYAYIAGQMHGPYEIENLKPFLQPDLMVCREGTQDWLAAKAVPELRIAPAPSSQIGASPAPLAGASARSPLQPIAFAAPSSASPNAMSGPGAVPGPSPRPAPMPSGAAPKAGALPETAPRDLPPLLKEFWLICRNASSELLTEQKAKHWKKYFKNEQQIIVTELERRGLKA